MLVFVVHHLGDSENQSAKLALRDFYCFNAGFSGSPNGVPSGGSNATQFTCMIQVEDGSYFELEKARFMMERLDLEQTAREFENALAFPGGDERAAAPGESVLPA